MRIDESLVLDILDSVADEDLSAEDAKTMLAEAIDALVPTGPLDPFDGPLWKLFVSKAWKLMEKRTPEELQEASKEARKAGKLRKASRLRTRALRRVF